MLTCLWLGALALLPADPAPDDGPARKAAETCLKAIHDKDWKTLAAHLHPDSLASFKDAVAPALKRAAKGAPEDLRDAAALSLLEGLDAEKLLKSPPKEFLPAFLGPTLDRGVKILFAGMTAKVIGTVREGDAIHVLYRATGKVLYADGTDDDGAGVKKLALTGAVTRTGTLTLRRSGGTWKALVPDEIQAFAHYLKAEWKER